MSDTVVPMNFESAGADPETKQYDMFWRVQVPTGVDSTRLAGEIERYLRSRGWEPVASQVAQRQDVTVARNYMKALVALLEQRIATSGLKLSISAIRDAGLSLLIQPAATKEKH